MDERERVEGEWRRWKRTRDARKRAYLELEAMLLDSGVITKEALWVRIPYSLHTDDRAFLLRGGEIDAVCRDQGSGLVAGLLILMVCDIQDMLGIDGDP